MAGVKGQGKHQKRILSKLEKRVNDPKALPILFLKELHGSRSRLDMRAIARAARKLEAAGQIVRIPVWYPLPISPERRRMILVALPGTEFLGCPIEMVAEQIAIRKGTKGRTDIEQAVFEYEILYFIKSEKGQDKPYGRTPKEFVKWLGKAEKAVMQEYEDLFIKAWDLDRDSYETPADLAVVLFSYRLALIAGQLKSAEDKRNPIKGDENKGENEGNKRHPIKGHNNTGEECRQKDG